jgi:hypothetical protein
MRCVCTCVTLLVSLLLAAEIAAQPPEPGPPLGFAVTPTSLSLDAQPGRKLESKLTLLCQENLTASRFRITVMDLGQAEAGSTTPVDMGYGTRSAGKWITIASEVEVPPMGRKEVPFAVTVPPNANGAYYAYLIVQVMPDLPEGKMVTEILPSVAVEVEVKTRSRSPLHVDVTDLAVAPGGEGSEGELILTIANTGNWKASVEGDVLLYGAKGTFPHRVSLPYGRGGRTTEIYPGMEVTLHCPLPDLPAAGTYRAVGRLLLNSEWQSRAEFEVEVPKTLAKGSRKGRLLSKSEYDLDLWVEPDLIEVTVPPGASRTIPIRLQNRDEREAEIRLGVSGVRVEKSGLLTYAEGAASEAGWISVSPETVVVAAKRTSTVRAQVTVPEGRPETGMLMGAVRLSASAQSREREWQSGNEFGVLVVAVDPKAPPAELAMGDIRLIRSSPEKNPATAVVTVKNRGGRVAEVFGTIALERATGHSIATMNIGRDQREVIVPGGEREFRMPLGALDAGKFRVVAELTTAGEKKSSARAETTFKSVSIPPTGL